jgi:hypothetical protein
VSTRTKALIAVAAALAALAWFFWVREIPVHYAAIVAMAIGALAYTALRTWERLRYVYRRDRRRWPRE